MGRRLWVLGTVGAVIACSMAMLATPRPALAGTVINVTSPLDVVDGTDGKCTLREAIIAVNTQSPSGATPGECPAGTGGDTINLGIGSYVLASGALSITKDVTINGGVVNANSAVTNDRAFDVGPNAHVTLAFETILNGRAPGDGGAIRANGWLTLSNVIIQDSVAANGGGLAVLNSGEAVLNVVLVQHNHATGSGGGIYDLGGNTSHDWNRLSAFGNSAGANGGGLFLSHSGSLNIDTLQAAYNESASGGGVFSYGGVSLHNVNIDNNLSSDGGAGIFAYNSLTMTDSLIAVNSISTTTGLGGGIDILKASLVRLDHVGVISNTAASGGGIYNRAFSNALVSLRAVLISGNRAITEGAGIYSVAPFNLTNVTLSGNSTAVDSISGKYGGAIFHTDGIATIVNTTIADNFAGFFNVGASVYVTGTAFMQVKNTIIAAVSGYTCLGTVTSLGHNLDQSTNFCNFGGSDIKGQDPILGPLRNNGGGLSTRALLRGSPAIDHGSNVDCPATDARDFPRPVDGDGDGSKICDIGAYEAWPETFLPLIRR